MQRVDKVVHKKKPTIEVSAAEATELATLLEAFYNLEKKGHAAFLEYACTDILDHDFKFGLYNPCLLNSVKMCNILHSFNNNNFNCFSLRSVIPIILPSNVIDLSTLNKDISIESIDQYSTHLLLLHLKWDNDEGIHEIIAMGGWHCCATLLEWLKQRDSDEGSEIFMAQSEESERQICFSTGDRRCKN
ncbi:hypothetical protein J3R82DRAFT_11598 [Butyriboletus roseoflavus]|nr:hypothetical protein J3R82DRAFT_11598 [Butyriboletus roseoflavus]